MTEIARSSDFKAHVEDVITRFTNQEPMLRGEYVRATESDPSLVDSLLERVTRRHLIDPVLRALGWDPDIAGQVAEEVRGYGDSGKRFYFDYLGKTESQFATLLVEAKHCDTKFVSKPYKPTASSREAPRLLIEALDVVKRNPTGPYTGPLLADWMEWLSTLLAYVRSLDETALSSLRRVVISAGSWMIIFEDPKAAFATGPNDATLDEASIHCFASLEEIRTRARDIFNLLDRERLVDTLHLTLTETEALRKIPGRSISRYWRGVIIATHMSGVSHQAYPTRSIYPAIVVESGDRIFGVGQFAPGLEEPRDQDNLDAFIDALQVRAGTFEKDLLRQFDRSSLLPSPLAELPPYRPTLGQPARSVNTAAAVGSTTASSTSTCLRGLVRLTGEPAATHEYLVVTGEVWFFKLASYGKCDFHDFQTARINNVAASTGRFGALISSYTETAQHRHCEHNPFRAGTRAQRCEILPIETHLCCKTCVFESLCWQSDSAMRPCPSD